MTKLQQIIQSNRLEAFFPPPKLQQLVDRLTRLDFRYYFQQFCLSVSSTHVFICLVADAVQPLTQSLSGTAGLLQMLVASSLSHAGLGVLCGAETVNTANVCIVSWLQACHFRLFPCAFSSLSLLQPCFDKLPWLMLAGMAQLFHSYMLGSSEEVHSEYVRTPLPISHLT